MSIRVSIVDDDAPARQILADWLRYGEGFSFVSDYGSAEEAMPHLVEEKPDVVLMDINLPGASGIDCVRRLKPVLPATQFLMLTVYKDNDSIFNALAVGATGYLLKRTSREELYAAIREVSAGGSPMTTSIARKVVQHFHQVPSAASPVVDLSTREREVLDLLARGLAYKEIADTLKISPQTVGTYTRRIYEKLQVHSRGEAVALLAQDTHPGRSRGA